MLAVRLLVSILILSPTIVYGQSCKISFSETLSPQTKKELNLLEALNPQLVSEFLKSNLENPNHDLYMVIKNEAWTFLPIGMKPWKNIPELPPGVLENIRNNSSKKFDVREIEPEQAYMFYANALQGRYIAVARLIRSEYLDSISQVEHKLTRQFLERVYDDLLLSDLGRPENSPERAQETLLELRNLDFPWAAFETLALRYFENAPEGTEVAAWLGQQSEAGALNRNQLQLFEKNLLRPIDNKRYCCRNNPGCMFCPNNRSFLSE